MLRRNSKAYAVGSTQLLVLGVQLHPQSAWFWVVDCASCSHRLKRHHQVPSPGTAWEIQAAPRPTSCPFWSERESAHAAKLVTQQPSLCPIHAGHDPSGSWAPRNQAQPRSRLLASCSCWLQAARAIRVQAVGSTALLEPGRSPQPPSEFWASHRNGRQSSCKKEPAS